MTGLLAIVALLLLACGGPDLPQDTAPGPTAQVWVHVIDGCVSDTETNCQPSLHLCAGERAYAQVSDIINIGTWSEVGDSIVTSFPAADVPEAWTFASAEDGATLTDDWLGWTWEIWEDPAVQHCS